MSLPLNSTAIVCDGKLVQDAVTRPVPWWSFGKTVLAAAAMVLVRDGKLALDIPLANQPYTLRQLLQHTAGVPNYSDLDIYTKEVECGAQPWPMADMLDRVQSGQLLFQPGQGWRYSNTGYLLVRQLIETALGTDLQHALQQLVFSPLAIAGVTVAAAPADLLTTAWGNPGGYHPDWVYHGLLVGSPASAALLLDRLLTGQLLPASLLAEMMARVTLGNELPGRPWFNFGYGLGCMMAQAGPAGKSCGHTGAGPGSVAAVYHFPDHRRTVAAFAPAADQSVVEWAVVEAAAG
ncbi:serine hydrolase domain-containing protein [Herbaspirillum autotrophicum]|uniref:serine hydrolase domain-containing protein n=1 Tax=Herbaspirillum autotrophicum TaxID=180195 RepID=UPI00067B0B21|nr:serine hydrolase domain-containing protein [Herbaspirillum autotrophicum]